MNKVAFFTTDVESFFDTSCVKEKGIRFDKNHDGAEGFAAYLSLLDEYDIRATLFLTVDTANRWQEILKKALKNGHRLAVHAYNHEDVTRFSSEEFISDVTKAKNIVEEIYGIKVAGYRAPCFGINESKIEILKSAGYCYDSSALNFGNAFRSDCLPLGKYDKINDAVYEKDGFFEVKPCVAKTFFGRIPVCGGGYLRLAPWAAVKSSVKKYIKNANAYLFYVHPFETYCGKLPKYKELSLFERLFVSRGRKSYLKKIRNIIEMLIKNGYEFSSIEDYLTDLKENHGRINAR